MSASRPGVTPGWLIAFEGIDGCGKGTQLKRLTDWLARERPERAVVVLREPGGTPVGEALRELLLHADPDELGPLSEVLLLMASRGELVRQRIAPLRAQGTCVLLDRSHYSTAAYQGAGLGLDEAYILELAERVMGAHLPERVVLLDVDPELAAARRGPAGRDRIEARGLDYYRRVAEAYRRFARQDPARFVPIDGSVEPERVHALILEGLADVL